MAKTISYNSGKFDSYTLTLENGTVQLECYLKGSVTGGTGTECAHTIEGENVALFLAAAEVADFSELEEKARKLRLKGWRILHDQITDFQTSSWSWSETNWDD